MDAKTQRFFTYLLYFCLLVGVVILCFNSSDRLNVLLIYAAFSTLIIYHHLIYFQDPRTKGKYILSVTLVLALCIQYFDHTFFTGFYIVILIAYTLFAYEAGFSVPLTVIAVLAHGLMLLYKSSVIPSIDLMLQFSTFLIPRVLIIALIVIARHNITINMKNELLAEALQEKNDALEDALDQLSAYADELQKTAELRAREKLMHELHDKLGHMLATASIGTQAAVVLIDKDTTAAKTRLEMVVQQIQSAMQSLREVISGSTINSNEYELSFIQSLVSLMSETEKRTGISIVHNLSQNDDELSIPKQSFIYNALMEGLTNGLRHGAATRFEFSLNKRDKLIHFCLSDNGNGFNNITFGYGLSKMLGDARRFGATLEIRGQNGCTLEIMLPIEACAAMEDEGK